MAGGGEQDGAVVGAVGADGAGHIAGQLFPAAVCHLSRGGLGVQPAAIFGDADLDHFIPGGVHIVHKGACRYTADLVLTGHTAEQQRHAQRAGVRIFFGIHGCIHSSILIEAP